MEIRYKSYCSWMLSEWSSALPGQLKILFFKSFKNHFQKDSSNQRSKVVFLHISSELMIEEIKGTSITFPRLFALCLLKWDMMGLKINFELTMQIGRLKGSLNGFWASFFFVLLVRLLSPDFHYISITSASKWNQIRFFMMSLGPLKRIMLHRIYDNLSVRNVAKKSVHLLT